MKPGFVASSSAMVHRHWLGKTDPDSTDFEAVIGNIAGGLGAHIRAYNLSRFGGHGGQLLRPLRQPRAPSDLSNDRHERRRVWAETAAPHAL